MADEELTTRSDEPSLNTFKISDNTGSSWTIRLLNDQNLWGFWSKKSAIVFSGSVSFVNLQDGELIIGTDSISDGFVLIGGGDRVSFPILTVIKNSIFKWSTDEQPNEVQICNLVPSAPSLEVRETTIPLISLGSIYPPQQGLWTWQSSFWHRSDEPNQSNPVYFTAEARSSTSGLYSRFQYWCFDHDVLFGSIFPVVITLNCLALVVLGCQLARQFISTYKAMPWLFGEVMCVEWLCILKARQLIRHLTEPKSRRFRIRNLLDSAVRRCGDALRRLMLAREHAQVLNRSQNHQIRKSKFEKESANKNNALDLFTKAMPLSLAI